MSANTVQMSPGWHQRNVLLYAVSAVFVFSGGVAGVSLGGGYALVVAGSIAILLTIAVLLTELRPRREDKARTRQWGAADAARRPTEPSGPRSTRSGTPPDERDALRRRPARPNRAG